MPRSVDTQPRSELPTGTITFLFSDIEGSTKLVHRLRPDAYRELLERHHRMLREAFAAHGGVERGTQGDAFLVIFRDARSAIGAALDAQRALAVATWPEDVELRVRMGLHSGEGIPGGDDYIGLDINRAARIAAAAHGGQVLLSDSTRALAEGALPEGVAFRDLGRHRLKDIEAPERLFMLLADGLQAAFPPLRSSEERPGNLPARLTTFIGRERDLDDLGTLLGENHLLTLTGPGGTGKTSLAVELARHFPERFPDGAWFVPLESIIDGDLVPSAIAATLGLREAAAMAPAELVHHHLRERTLLLLLDNLEQIASAGTAVSGLLRESPGLTVVATSRAPLRVAGEQEYPVAPMQVPELAAAGTDAAAWLEVRDADAVRLFVDRARRTQPSFSLTAQNASAVAEICRRLDGLPLGIELAAARVGLLAPSAIAERLARHLSLPGTGARDLPDRQRTIEQAISWSYDLLGPPMRRLFARLSVFAGGCELDAAEVVCGPSDELGVDVLEGIAHLVEQSLVKASPTDSGTRFAMLETVRAFAASRLGAADEATELRRRHGLHFLGLAESAAQEMPGRRQLHWLRRLDAEQGNLRAATQWAIETNSTEPALRFAAALWRYWQLGGSVSEGRTTVDSLLGVAGLERSAARLRAVEARGGLLYWSGDGRSASEAYTQQLTLARELGDNRAQADALFNIATTMGQAGDVQAAFAMLDEAFGLYEGLGDQRGLGRVTAARGFIAVAAGDPAAGCGLTEDALVRLRETDDVFFETVAFAALGWGNFVLNRFDKSLPAWRGGMELSRVLGDVSSTTFGLEFSAVFAAEAGLWEQAATMRAACESLNARYAVQPPRSVAEIVSRPDYADRISEALSPDRLEAAVEKGRQMSLEEAYDFALRLSHDAEAKLTAGTRLMKAGDEPNLG
jgi:predicted ATPase/class 3 adenylate cyclase